MRGFPRGPPARHERSEWRARREGCASERPTRAETGPASPRCLAALFPCRRTTHASPTSRSGWSAFGVILPDNVSVIVSRRDLDKAVPKLGAPDVLFRLFAAHVALEHDVTVVRRPDDLPTVLSELVKEIRDFGQPFRRLGDVLTEPSRVRALTAIGSIELVADRSEDVNEDESRRRRHVREFSRAPLRSGSRRRSPSRLRRAHRS